MGNRQLSGIALKTGATLTGLGTLAMLAIFVARATDNSSITNYDRGYGPFAAALSPAPGTTPDLAPPSAAPAVSPTPETPALGATSDPTMHTQTSGVAQARAALAVLTPLGRPPAAGLPAPPSTSGPAVNPPWTLSPAPAPTPTSGLPPWRPHGSEHAAMPRHGDPQPGAHGHGGFAGRAGHGHTFGPDTTREPAPAPQPPTVQSNDGSPNAPGGHGHKAEDPKNVAVETDSAQG